jgi:hypothetical protein
MRRSIPLVLAVLVVTLSDAPVHAQIPVTDVATTLRNAATAATKELLLRLQAQQHSELRRMAHRLSMFTSLDKYAVREVPLWRIHDFEDAEAFLFARPYHAALNYGDDAGLGYGQVARTRMEAASALGSLAPSARQAIERMLATLATTADARFRRSRRSSGMRLTPHNSKVPRQSRTRSAVPP